MVFKEWRGWGRAIFFCLLGLLLASGLAIGCPHQSPLIPLRIGLNYWPGYTIALYGQTSGIFAQRGLKVEFFDFNSQQDNIRANLRGSLDLSFVPLWELLQADPTEQSPVVLTVVDISAGSDGIVAQKNLRSMGDLVGKKIGCKLGTVSHLILLEALQHHRISPQAVEIVDVLNETAVALLQAHQLDAAVLWQPMLETTREAIGGNIVFTTQEVDSLVVDTLATYHDFLTHHRDRLEKFLLAWLDILAAVKNHPQKVFADIAPRLQAQPADLLRDFQGLRVGDMTLNTQMLEEGKLNQKISTMTRLLHSDPRHKRMLRQDVLIARELWQQIQSRWLGGEGARSGE